MSKFNIGDKIVPISEEGISNPSIKTIIGISDGNYIIAPNKIMDISVIDAEHVNENSVLWYFETYEKFLDEWKLTPRRKLYSDILKDCGISFEPQPMYTMGFRLSKNVCYGF